MKCLAIDTELTGLFRYDRRADDPSQPRLVEFAGVLVDIDTREIVEKYDTLIQPAGWQIPNDAMAVHGISDEDAMREGIPILDALATINRLWDACDFVAGYNVDFDLKILRAERRRAGQDDLYGQRDKLDLMRPLTEPCQIPPTPAMLKRGRKGFKTPSLSEAAKIIVGIDFEGAHRAMADVEMEIHLLWYVWNELGKRPVADSKDKNAVPLTKDLWPEALDIPSEPSAEPSETAAETAETADGGLDVI